MKKFLFAALFLALTATQLQAAETNRFTVISYKLNRGIDAAELCLTFSAHLNISDRAAILGGIKLDMEGKKVSLAAHDLSLTPTQLCIQRLQHERDYHLTLNNVYSVDGVKLGVPINLDFKVPDRKPEMVFDQSSESLIAPSSTTPRLEAVNIKEARLTLYRVSNPDLYPLAWKQYQQSSLAPSESLTFARENGQQFWQSDLVLSDAPNQTQKTDIPLPSTPPGLYFLTAAPRSAPSGIEADPKMLAGIWLIKSDLRLMAQNTRDGFIVFAKSEKSVAPKIDLRLLDKEDNTIGEASTSTDGSAKIGVSAKTIGSSAMIIGTSKTGDLAFLPLPTSSIEHELTDAEIITASDSYKPGDIATFEVRARKTDGRAIKIEHSLLRLTRPDGKVEIEKPVTIEETGAPSFIDMPISLVGGNGDWTVSWYQPDNTRLASKTIKVEGAAGKLDLQAMVDRKIIEQDNSINVAVKLNGDQASHRTGKANWTIDCPRFTSWPDYFFGACSKDGANKLEGSSSFITDANGNANISINVDPIPEGAINLSVTADGATTPYSANLPFRSQTGWIGVKPISENNPNRATFNVIAIDNNLKRQALGKVFYQIFEEGRSFEWYQAENGWKHRPLPLRHRIGGGHLELFANSDNVIRWPIIPGNYILEITDANGNVLTQHSFQSPTNADDIKAIDQIKLSAQSETLTSNKQNHVTLTLKKPMIVGIVIDDGQMRQTIHQAFPSGNNLISFTPTSAWSSRVQIKASTVTGEAPRIISQSLVIPLYHPERDLGIQAELKSFIVTGQKLSLPITVQNIKPQQPTFVNAIVTKQPALGSAEPSIIADQVSVDRNGKATLSITLPEFAGSAKIKLSAWNETQSGSRVLTVPAMPALAVKADVPDALFVEDQARVNIRFINQSSLAGEYSYSLTSEDGINLTGKNSGAVFLKRGQSQSLTPTISADGENSGVLVLSVTGPDKARTVRKWPIEVQGNSSLATETAQQLDPQQFMALKPLTTDASKIGANKEGSAIISAVPTLTIMKSLPDFLERKQFTTVELSDWLILSKEWKETITRVGWQQEENIHASRENYLSQMLKRQNADGSFPSWPGQHEGNITSTAAALTALHGESKTNAIAALAANHATQWLQRKLENTWFEESERSERACGFLALAYIGKSDLSALRYYADTSKDKNLTPLAAAQLGLSFALNKDEGASRLWMKPAKGFLSESSSEDPVMAWKILAVLSDNAYLDWENIYDMATNMPVLPASSSQTGFLRALWSMGQRAGSWQITINESAKKHDGFYVISKAEARNSIILHNTNSQALFVAKQNAPPAKDQKQKKEVSQTLKIQQQLYKPSGEKVQEEGSLQRKETYILEISGSYPTSDKAFIIQNARSAGIKPIVPRDLTAEALMEQYPWIGDDLTDWQSMDAAEETTGFILSPKSNKSPGKWKVAFIVRAASNGDFILAQPEAREIDGTTIAVESNRVRISIK
ncbi:MAG: hypothetical protein PHX43_02145 [Alphaproteobacteria bacterium]|nr:hypothetical protein [Alphaproteobacteria bacterium]